MIKSIKDQFLSIVQKIRGGDTKILVNNITVKPPHRISQDIQKWRNAIQQAEGFSQQRSQLLDLYEDIMLDGYLKAVLQKRIDQVTNKNLVFVKKDGSLVEEVSNLTNKTFFEDLLIEVMNAKFYGHSVIEPLWPAIGKDTPGQTILIPRKHVKPRWGIVTKNEFDLQGVDYREKPFVDNVIEVGKPEELGLLMAVAQYVIYKRGNFGDWAEYNEIFGIPFRWATYNNEQSRSVLETALETAGPAGYVVAPEDANLEFLNGNASGQGGEVFKLLRQACNEEIGLAILGNTMTTMESRSSGYAQSKTHAEGEDELSHSDRRYALRVLNEKLIPILKKLGYPVSEGHWEYQEEKRIPLQDRIEIDLKVSGQVPVGDSYWYETYGIPKPKASDISDPKPTDDTPAKKDKEEKEEEAEKKKLNLSVEIANFYDVHGNGCDCGHCLNLANIPKKPRISSKLEKIILDNVYQGNYDINPELHRQYYRQLRSTSRTGFSRSLSKADNWDDFVLQQGMKRNISDFAVVKQHALIEELKAIANKPAAVYNKAAKNIIQRYNRAYFSAELNTFQSAAHSAGQWNDFLDRADLYPNLRYSTTGDGRVRDAHAAIDGAVYPVSDPFWDTHTPPNGWNCRCVLIQTDEETITKPLLKTKKGFGSNPFKAKSLIQKDHPYFDIKEKKLNELLDFAENLRAETERPGVMKIALQDKGKMMKLGNKKAQVTEQDIKKILSSESKQKGVRNSLLTTLPLAMEELTAVNIENKIATYQLSLLDHTFEFSFEEISNSLILKKIISL